ncbi:Glyoxylase, beta-lactamase superfamily II [Fodinibius roseus]|uniref:Glyoxylase, beta-lactamase superfamily II n=1 Tax=Fodinibius roseus TaxID=1194090 RepID=A0A1M4TQK6_9BACT|nr:MBL fold metallo-hydrolase [Fodinibius roseus]SHE46547.1 Glyoxylase, beta-lactamase superfamily II [Fodinibius roseus]
MQINCFTVGPFAENTYLLTEKQQALIIDPGFSDTSEFDQVISLLDSQEVHLRSILLTHAHVDHLFGLSMVLEHFDVPVYLSDKDRYLWNNYASQAALFGFQVRDFGFDPEILPVDEDWTTGPFMFDIRYTPGHSPDHLSLYHKRSGSLIVGDALFKEGVGRTDLYKGDMSLLKTSIREQLYTLPDETVVYPGHGPETTIGHEKQANPFVTG